MAKAEQDPAYTTDVERETLEVDVLIVGGGPAGLSAALRLTQLQKAQGGEPLSIAVLEKAREAGAHTLSGAVLDPSTLRDLIPDYQAKGAPLNNPVHRDHVYFLTERSKIPLPITPPPLRNHGNFIISLSAFVRWLSSQVETEGVDFFSGGLGFQHLQRLHVSRRRTERRGTRTRRTNMTIKKNAKPASKTTSKTSAQAPSKGTKKTFVAVRQEAMEHETTGRWQQAAESWASAERLAGTRL